MIRFAENLNKMIAAGLGGALEAPRTEVAVGHRVIYTEASGAVVNFESNVVAPVKNLRVTMEPIQDLHGQDAPYPPGGGKNMLDYSTAYITDTTTRFYSVSLIANQQYQATYYGDDSARIILYDHDTQETIIASSYTKVFSYTPTSDVVVDIQFYNSDGLTSSVNLFQMEKGSTSTPFAPYSNICPITGRDSVTVWREASYDPSADPALTIQLGTTVYGGTLDVSTGKLTVTHGEIASYNGEVLTGEWISDRDVYAAGTTPTIGAQVVYVLDTPQTIDLDPQQITTLKGQNNVWSDAGDVTLEYPYYEETEGY